jgi:membrane fusion protein, multidrug efflux system
MDGATDEPLRLQSETNREIRDHSAGARERRRSALLWIALGAAVLAFAVYEAVTHRAPASRAASPRSVGAVPIAVGTAVARSASLPIYLNGIGSVEAMATVTVKSRVDGQLLRIDVREGQLVRRGQLLGEIDPRPFQVQLEQAEGQMARDRAQLENAQRDLDRYRTLIDQDAVTRQQLDTQVATVAQLNGSVEADRGTVDSAKLQLDYCKITAPIDGRVGLRLIDPGNIVHATDTTGLFVVTQVEPIAVVFTIPEDSLPRVVDRTRNGGPLDVDAFNRDGTVRLARGRLLTIDNQIDPTTGTVKLKALFDNKDQALFPNQFVNARLLVETERNQVIVPAAAVRRGPQSTYVYVVKDRKAHSQNVSVAFVQGNDAAIAKGVSAGDTVIVDGVDELRDGSVVQARDSGAAAAPAGADVR